jgi:hypothetical protein
MYDLRVEGTLEGANLAGVRVRRLKGRTYVYIQRANRETLTDETIAAARALMAQHDPALLWFYVDGGGIVSNDDRIRRPVVRAYTLQETRDGSSHP